MMIKIVFTAAALTPSLVRRGLGEMFPLIPAFSLREKELL